MQPWPTNSFLEKCAVHIKNNELQVTEGAAQDHPRCMFFSLIIVDMSVPSSSESLPSSHCSMVQVPVTDSLICQWGAEP